MTSELIIDSFAGGGGASLGIELALGRGPDIAINHDREAIAMHLANHPGGRHYCEDVWHVDPVEATGGRPVGLAWFSPDCKHFSKAKGGRPVEKKIRGLAWVVIRWARAVRPRVIILENVEEFQDWGPLLGDGRPCPDRKGITFRRWKKQLENCGYKIECRELRACDYGTPTIRKRLFIVARCDGMPVRWPVPTHGQGLLPYRTAAECMDWSLPCPSIFERKRPLAEATLRRIARGVKRFVLDAAEPFIVTCNHGRDLFRGQGLNEPFRTITAAHEAHGLVMPFVTEHANASTQRNMPIDEPLRTQCAQVKGGHFALVAPTIIQTGYGERPPLWRCADCGFTYDRAELPLCGCSKCGSEQDPVEIKGQLPRVPGLDKPLGTVVAGGQKHALVAAFLAKHYGDHGQRPGSAMSEPVSTITTSDHNAVVAAHLLNLKGSDRRHRPLNTPAPTVTAGGTHQALVAALMAPYYGQGSGTTGRDLRDPAPTVTTKDRLQLVTVTIDGESYVLTDIGMRMLTPRELYRAQGFPDSYRIDIEIDGKRLSKAAQVRMCGNSVCPPIARAIVEANMLDREQGAVA